MSERALPRHVAIIMDGNGRWAKQHKIQVALGHRRGVEALRAIIRESSDLGIEALSLYAFSTENWKRSPQEVEALMALLLEFFTSEIDELDEKNVCIRILGDKGGKVFSRETMLETVWKYDYMGDARTVDVHIRRLREKIERNSAQPEFIFTKWGVGYYFTDKD